MRTVQPPGKKAVRRAALAHGDKLLYRGGHRGVRGGLMWRTGEDLPVSFVSIVLQPILLANLVTTGA